jgi:hypothetical protein
LAAGLGRGTGLEIGNPFGEWLGTRGYFVTQERNFGYTENALGGVQQFAVRLEFSEEGAAVLVVFLGGTPKDKDVVKVGETEIQVFEDVIHETMEGLGCVSKTEGHKWEFEKAKGCDDCGFLDVVGVDRNLVVSSGEVNFRKGGAVGKAVGVVLYVWDRVPVWDSASVQSSIISQDLQPLSFLGTRWRADDHGPSARLAVPSCNMALTRLWPLPSGQDQYGVGGRLLVGQALCVCDARCCVAPRGGSLLALLALETPPVGCRGVCLLR